MQQAIPYKSWLPLYTNNTKPLNLNISPLNSVVRESSNNSRNLNNMLSENAIMVFAKKGCCMSHVVKRLLLGLGVNPPVYEVDDEESCRVLEELETIVKKDNSDANCDIQFPAVFIGGKLFGGLDRLMATHISGELVPILKEAGVLWL